MLLSGTATVDYAELVSYHESGSLYTYYVKEVDAPGNDFVPENYQKTETGLAVTNTYVSPKIPIQATKVWSDQDNEDGVTRPVVSFELWRKHGTAGAGEKVVNATPVPATLTVNFGDQDKTDINGVAYEYYIEEVFVNASDVTNQNWDVQYDGLKATNSLKTPSGSLTITKALLDNSDLNGEEQGTPGSTPVPGATPLVFTFVVTGPYGYNETVTLSAGESTTLNDLYFGEYSVTETVAHGYVPSYTPLNGNVTISATTSEVTVTVSNNHATTSDPNVVRVNSTKVWNGGPSTDHTAITLVLQRKSAGGDFATVDGATYTVTQTATTPLAMFSYWWNNLPKHDAFGYEYTYQVIEADVVNGQVTINGNTYNVTTSASDGTTTITNTYQIPKTAAFTATKVWAEGNPAEVTRPGVAFELWQIHTGSGAEVRVAGPVAVPASGEVNFAAQDATDFSGVAYTYEVREVFTDPYNILNNNWTSTVDGMEVTNAVIDPVGKLIIKKDLLDASSLPGGMGASGLGTGDRLKFNFTVSGPYGFYQTFELSPGDTMSLFDLYYGTYIVTETDPLGFVASYHETQAVTLREAVPEITVTVKNDFKGGADDPNLVNVHATKTWINGAPGDHEAPTMILSRDSGGASEVVPATPAIMPGMGTSTFFTYDWEGLPKYDPVGRLYTYSVTEAGVVDDIYMVGDHAYAVTRDGNHFANTYIVPTEGALEARKVWSGGPTARPALWFQLWRAYTSEGVEISEPVPGAERKPIGTSILVASWSGLAETTLAADVYTFFVKEGYFDDSGFVEGAHPDYTAEVTADGNGVYEITNTYIPRVSVGDYVWFDVNKDGLQDASDRPIEGAILEITTADGDPVFDIYGNPVAATLTDEYGYYAFVNLPVTDAGYKVTVTPPGDYIPTLAEQGSDGSIDSSTAWAVSTALPNDGDADMTLDFGFVRPEVSVGNYVWFDVNKDGLQDDSDRPIEGVTLTITHKDGSPVFDVDGNPVTTAVTDEHGYYEFTRLPITEDGYTVTITPPEGYIPTLAGVGDDRAIDSSTGEATSTPLLTDGAKDMTLDFGFVKPEVKVGDYVWFDVNKDGLQDDTDRPIAGVTLTLTHLDGSPVYDVNGDLVEPAVTDVNGYYEFAKLPVTEEGYKVTITPPEGYIPTLAGVGDDRAIDSSTGEATSTPLLTDGDEDMTLDFGFVKPEVTVGDYVWFDVNKDGIQDETDRPIEGVTLTITHLDGSPVFDVNGDPVDPTVTNEDGYYEFARLPVTEEGYKVTITPPEGYIPTLVWEGDDRSIDSSIDYELSTTLLNDGDEDMTLDFGFVKPEVKVGDYVWFDVNKDGIQDATDRPIEGVTLTITHLDGSPVYNVNGDLVGPTVTDEHGYYEFAQLPVTEEGYKVTITPPAGYIPTQAGVGGDRGIDSSTGFATSIVLPNDGDEDMTLDFGFVLKPTTPDVPKTGEDSSPLPYIGFGLALAAGVLILIRRKRQNEV